MSYIIDQTIQKEICKLLHWSEQQYNEFVYDCGLAYIQAVIDNESEYIRQFIQRSETYWNWWKMHWEMREKEFIEACNGWDEGVENRLHIYKKTHNPYQLAGALYLNGKVLEESYAVMIEDLHKNVHRSKVTV